MTLAERIERQSMKFRDLETGEVLSKASAHYKFCEGAGKICLDCDMGKAAHAWPTCVDFAVVNPYEAARIMGYEVVEIEWTQTEVHLAKGLKAAIKRNLYLWRTQTGQIYWAYEPEEWEHPLPAECFPTLLRNQKTSLDEIIGGGE